MSILVNSETCVVTEGMAGGHVDIATWAGRTKPTP
jgi:hypothetical protein